MHASHFLINSNRTHLTAEVKAEILLVCHFEKLNHDSFSF